MTDPLRITHVVRTRAFAGVERHVVTTARQQARDGHVVAVIGGDGAQMIPALRPFDVAWSPSRSYWADVESIVDSAPHLVHSHMTSADVVAIAARRRIDVPLVSTLHFAQPRGGHRLRALPYRRLARHFDAHIAISSFVATRVGLDCEVIPNSVEWTEPERLRQRKILVAQRLEREKHTELALHAFAASGLADEEWRMFIAGDGRQRDDLIRLAHRLDLAPNVMLAGFDPEVPSRMTRASITLATAPAEPFGLSVVESMAAATPVVAAAGGAHLETVGPVAGAALFTPGSVDECAWHLRRLAADDEERTRYGDALRQRWAAEYTPDRAAARLEAVYRRVLGRSD